jgi:hypothetical protein
VNVPSEQPEVTCGIDKRPEIVMMHTQKIADLCKGGNGWRFEAILEHARAIDEVLMVAPVTK